MNRLIYDNNLSLEERFLKLLSYVEKLEKDIEDLKLENKFFDGRLKRLENNQSENKDPLIATNRKVIVNQNQNNYPKVDFSKNSSFDNRPAQIHKNIIVKNNSAPSTSNNSIGFVNEYNAIMSRSGDYNSITAREEFFRKFQFISVTCSNTDMLINNPKLEAEFTVDEDGDYWLLKLKGTTYAALPNITDYTEDVHVARAMNQVFKSNYEFGKIYSHITVIQPALFENTSGKWKITKKGELILR